MIDDRLKLIARKPVDGADAASDDDQVKAA